MMGALVSHVVAIVERAVIYTLVCSGYFHRLEIVRRVRNCMSPSVTRHYTVMLVYYQVCQNRLLLCVAGHSNKMVTELFD